ncbi:MAG: hypothetical protein COA88_12885 [Kordia sp.]|nr:MAG: hypothetical protein COA88_12885 [Kordia sp.]
MRKIIYTLLLVITSLFTNAQCPDPSNLIVPIVTETSANLEWVENGTATSWEVEVVIAGNIPTGVGIAANAIPYTAVGLTSGIDYEFYVISNCASGVNSSWVGPFNFTTFPCDFTIVPTQTTDACLEYCFTPSGSQFGTFFDFNSGLLPTGWASSPYTVGAPCWTDMIDNTPYFWAGVTNNNGARLVTTNILDVSLGGTIEFYMRYGSDDPDPGCESPDLVDEGVFLQYSIDNGINWVTINTWNPTGVLSDPLYSWIQYIENIPVGAQTQHTSFRWYQPQNSGAEYDNWGLDSILITANTDAEFEWDFGDGNISTEQSPCHSFSTPGDYLVSLLVTAPNCISTESITLSVVDDIQPIIACQNLALNIDGDGSVVITPSDIDNGCTDNCAIETMTLSQTVFDCTDIGQNMVTLTVTDAYGNVNTCNATVMVVASSPGTNGTISLCGNSGVVDLFDSLGGNPGTGGSWSPSLASGTGIFDPAIDLAGVYIYTASACSSAGASVTVVIHDTPQIDSLLNQDVCVSYTLPVITGTYLSGNEQYYTEPNGNGTAYNSGTVLNYLDFQSYPTTLYIYDESGTTPNCIGNEENFELSITLIALNTSDIEMCEDDLDGFLLFDLTLNTASIMGAQSNTVVTYYESQADADAGTLFITAPTAYQNLIASPPFSSQTIFARIESTINSCYDTVSFEIKLNTLVFNLPTPLYTCDDDNDSFAYFNLDDATAQISGGNSNIVVTYYETLAEAQLGEIMGANIDASVLYQNIDTGDAGAGDIQTLYINVLDTNTNCLYVGIQLQEKLDLHILRSPVLPNGTLTYPLCDDYDVVNDGFVIFDLLSSQNNILLANIDVGTTPSDYVVTYYTDAGLTNPIPNPGAYPNISNPQTIYVSVVSGFNSDNNGNGCETVKEIILKVDSLPDANDYFDYVLCDDDYFDDMNQTQTFDLPSQLPHMISSTDGLVITYYEVLDLSTGVLSLIPVSDLENYENINNPQDIFVEFVNEANCSVVKILKLTVSPNPTPLTNTEIIATLGNNGVMEECDGNVDGAGDISEQIATFDITQWETSIIDGENGVSVAYYITEDDAAAGENAIPNPGTYNNISNPQTIYVGVINDGTGVTAVGTGCTTVVTFQLYVPVPQVTVLASKEVICIDINGVPLADISLPLLTAIVGPEAADSYDYQWMLNGVVIPGATAQTYSVTEPGDYTVTVSGPMDFDCINYSATQTISVSGSPEAYNASVTTQAFADSHQIVATATSTIPGVVFWYSLDGGEPTTNGTFNNVLPGTHKVKITDGQECWFDIIDVMIVDYPHFFTPNGDGINDTWAIIGQAGIPVSQIYIFDRFGKLLSQLDPDGAGWDGTYNGSQMPASDYWFKIIYIEGTNSTQKEFKAHFSLKR